MIAQCPDIKKWHKIWLSMKQGFSQYSIPRNKELAKDSEETQIVEENRSLLKIKGV